jgi:hypothetical protein
MFHTGDFGFPDPDWADFGRCHMISFAIYTFWIIIAFATNMCVITTAMTQKTVCAVKCTMAVLLALVATKRVGNIRFNPQDVEACLDL